MARIKYVCTLLVLLLLVAACTTKIPIVAVQLADDDGRNRVPISGVEISQWVEQSNRTWEDQGYEFTFDAKKDLVLAYSTVLNNQPPDDNDDLWEFYRIAGNYLASQLPDNAIPVFFRAKGKSGWSWGPGNTDFISMPAYTNTCLGKQVPGKPCPGGCCPNDSLLSTSSATISASPTPSPMPTATRRPWPIPTATCGGNGSTLPPTTFTIRRPTRGPCAPRRDPWSATKDRLP